MCARNIVIGQKVNAAKIQRAKELCRQMTKEERMLWQHLRGNRFQGLHFRRQQIIDGFIVDVSCPRVVCASCGSRMKRSAEIFRECCPALRRMLESKPNPPAPFPDREGGACFS
jgi:hypothetical protein